MKSEYIKPEAEVLKLESWEELLGSVSSDYGIGYGSVDEEGAMDPASRTIMTNAYFSDLNR